jgi:hypothetical protein
MSRGCKEESLDGSGFEGGLVTSGAERASKVPGVWQQVVGLRCEYDAKDGRLRVVGCFSGGNVRVGLLWD